MILVIMGVSGSGKSTVGQNLAAELGWSFYDGDDFHPAANVEKMANGIALTDADRADWLAALARLIRDLSGGGRSGVLACSALKQSYRETLQQNTPNVQFVYLKGSYDLILKRLQARKGHYMRPELLKSQFETLEEPGQALVVDVAQPVAGMVRQIRQAFSL
ncbi:MAG: gluconokinase [Anaerolineales bacterium]